MLYHRLAVYISERVARQSRCLVAGQELRKWGAIYHLRIDVKKKEWAVSRILYP
jgi:hypothetical protein